MVHIWNEKRIIIEEWFLAKRKIYSITVTDCLEYSRLIVTTLKSSILSNVYTYHQQQHLTEHGLQNKYVLEAMLTIFYN